MMILLLLYSRHIRGLRESDSYQPKLIPFSLIYFFKRGYGIAALLGTLILRMFLRNQETGYSLNLRNAFLICNSLKSWDFPGQSR